MNETHLTVVGTVCTAITPRRVGPDSHLVVNFRVACNERRRDRSTGEWGDGDSFYIQVSCWRRLAENVLASLVVGDPVVVTGRIYTRSWETEGEKRSTVNLEASAVGVDLTRQRAVVVRQRERVVYDVTDADLAPSDTDGPASDDLRDRRSTAAAGAGTSGEAAGADEPGSPSGPLHPVLAGADRA